ncbi:MAG: amino acid adenylation domain-containing protein, partial [Sandaracinaceae bacterium]|nr:amino acid adenylation domain-containing protein [Sandaracinaceae bacterium]
RSYRRVLEEVIDILGASPLPPPPTASFGEFCRFVHNLNRDEESRRLSQAIDGASSLHLPFLQTPKNPSEHGELSIVLDDISQVLHGAQKIGASLANVIQGTWAWWLGRRARCSDVLFAITRSGRNPSFPGVREVVGCLITTLPFRVRIDESRSAQALIEQARDFNRFLQSCEHVEIAPILAQQHLSLSSLVVVERYDIEEVMVQRNSALRCRRAYVLEQSDFPVVLAAYQRERGLRLSLEFNKRLLTPNDAQLWLMQIGQAILMVGKALAEEDHRPLYELDTLIEEERTIITRFASGPDQPPSAPLPSPLVHAEAHPHAGAIKDCESETTWSWRRLQKAVQALCELLERAGVKTSTPVFVLSHRSAEWVAAMLSIWVKGSTYVPLDPRWPENRLRSICEEVIAEFKLGKPVALVAPELVSKLRPILPPTTELITLTSASLANPTTFSLSHTLAQEGVAYVLYTSGSTGKPKGVVIPYEALTAHAQAVVKLYGLTPEDRVLQFASPGFDVSIEEVLPTLVAGARLVLRSEGAIRDLTLFVREIEEERITVLNLPSPFFHELVLFLNAEQMLWPNSVRLVVVGSERVTPESWRCFSEIARKMEARSLNPPKLINAYGPTEATITSVCSFISDSVVPPDGHTELPIGLPIGACRAHVIRLPLGAEEGDEAPSIPPSPPLASIEEPGELWISGPQLALGYLAREQATHSCFVSLPLAPPFDRAYRTGDLVKRRRDGLLVFVGRMDRQVKLRGHRIELSEIENVLLSHPSVAQAAAIVEAQSQQLLAFVVCRTTPAPLHSLREHLSQHLPQHMIPHHLIELEAIPKTTNGKIDTQHLLRLASSKLFTTTNALETRDDEPQDDLEAWLKARFSEVLRRKVTDLNRSFFELGGHSILALRLLSELRKERPELEIDFRLFFENSSIRAFAKALRRRGARESSTIVQLNWPQGQAAEALPLFCLCGVQIYGPIARAMEKHRPVFGAYSRIEAQLLEGHVTSIDVPSIAREYVTLIHSQQPKGPYLLAGLSFGGIVAIEVAKQLISQNEKVLLVALWESALPRAFEPLPFPLRLKHLALRLLRGEEDLGLVFKRQLRKIKRIFRTKGPQPFISSSPPASVREAFALRDQVFFEASKAYQQVITPYSGRVILFRAREELGLSGEKVKPDLGWTGILPQDTPIHTISGNHLTILQEPGASEIATILEQEIGKLLA